MSLWQGSFKVAQLCQWHSCWDEAFGRKPWKLRPQKLKPQKLIHEKSLTLFDAFKLKAKFSRSYSFQSLSFKGLIVLKVFKFSTS